MLSAIITAIPTILALVAAVIKLMQAAQAKGVGYDQAAKDVMQKVLEDIASAQMAIEEADKAHLDHRDDTAFDPDFKRD